MQLKFQIKIVLTLDFALDYSLQLYLQLHSQVSTIAFKFSFTCDSRFREITTHVNAHCNEPLLMANCCFMQNAIDQFEIKQSKTVVICDLQSISIFFFQLILIAIYVKKDNP